MLGSAPPWVIDIAVIAGAITATLAAVGALLKTPMGRWVADAFDAVHDRVEERRRERWSVYLDELLPRHIAPVLYELRFNGGTSFRDGITKEVRDLRDEVRERLDRIELRQAMSVEDRADLRRQFNDYIGNQGDSP